MWDGTSAWYSAHIFQSLIELDGQDSATYMRTLLTTSRASCACQTQTSWASGPESNKEYLK